MDRRQAEIRRLERRIRLRLGKLVDNLAELEEEIQQLSEQLARRQSPMDIDSGYLPVEEQYKRVWETPSSSPTDQEEPGTTGTHFDLTDEKQVKHLYRQLARRYHPDLTQDSSEKHYRTKKMAALNEAYASRSLIELAALAIEPELGAGDRTEGSETGIQTIVALENELNQVQQRTIAIQKELQDLHNSPVVRLSLETKLAKQNGRDLLGEMAINLRQEIKRKQSESFQLRTRLNRLDR